MAGSRDDQDGCRCGHGIAAVLHWTSGVRVCVCVCVHVLVFLRANTISWPNANSIHLQNAHIVIPNDQTLVALGDLRSTTVWLVIIGLALIVALQHRGFKAAIIIGVAATASG